MGLEQGRESSVPMVRLSPHGGPWKLTLKGGMAALALLTRAFPSLLEHQVCENLNGQVSAAGQTCLGERVCSCPQGWQQHNIQRKTRARDATGFGRGMCHAQLPSLSWRMKKSPCAAIESGPLRGLGETQCFACGRAEDETSHVGVQGSVQLHWAETWHRVRTSTSRAEVSWDCHAVGTWTAGDVPWQGTFKLNWTGKVLPARDSQLTSVLYFREGVWLQEGVGVGAVPLLSLSCNSHCSACHPQQDSELYRWQPAPTQNWPPQLQALPERDCQEGEAAEEVAGR